MIIHYETQQESLNEIVKLSPTLKEILNKFKVDDSAQESTGVHDSCQTKVTNSHRLLCSCSLANLEVSCSND